MTDDFLGRRELTALVEANDERWTAHTREHTAHDVAHGQAHAHEQELSRHEERRLTDALAAHGQKHEASELAVATALESVDKLALLHADAHNREHLSHEQRHSDQAVAVAKAETAVDKRLEAMNEVRGQLREQSRTFVTSDRVESMQAMIDRRFGESTKHTNERYEENRRRIELIEKGDAKGEGRTLGQGAVVAIIVTAIGIVGTVVSIVVVLANFATGAP